MLVVGSLRSDALCALQTPPFFPLGLYVGDEHGASNSKKLAGNMKKGKMKLPASFFEWLAIDLKKLASNSKKLAGNLKKGKMIHY